MVTDKYIKSIQNMHPWPIISGWSSYVASTNFNNKLFFNNYFSDRTKNPGLVIANKKQSLFCFTEDKMLNVHSEAFEEFFINKKKFITRIEKFNQLSAENDEIYKKWTYEKINRTSFSRLIEILEKTRKIMWHMNGITWFVSAPIDKNICFLELKKNNVSFIQKDLDAIWEKATEPVFDYFEQVQINKILSLLAKKTNWKDISQDCQYFFTDYSFNTKSILYCENELKNKFKNFIKPSIAKKQIYKYQKNKSKKVNEYKKWIKSLPKNLKNLAEYLQIVMEVRDKRKNAFGKALTIQHRIAEKIFNEANVSFDLIPFYSIQELKRGSKYLKQNVKNLQKRQVGFVIYFDENGNIKKEISNFKNNLNKIKKYYSKKLDINNIKTSHIIQGTTGSPGNVKGVVKIILDVKNYKCKLNKNDILVTGMTRPEFLPLAKKAKAIITDEGGITCHAAVISRELKKPCIVGTKIATKILQDGDIVTLDGSKGIVKIIKKI